MQSIKNSKNTHANQMDFILKNCLPQQNRKYMQRKSQLAIADIKKAQNVLNGDSSNSDVLNPEHSQSSFFRESIRIFF